MPPSPPPRDDLLGQTIAGRYRIISRLGAGGMGVAYRAWDESAGLPVVIKIPKKAFLEDPTFAERFAREIRLLQGLEHPSVVPIVDVGEHDRVPFVVMRFLPGGSLSNRRLRGDDGKIRPNPPGMLHLWLPAVADALDFVHTSGVVHRDVKPANIFFDAFWGAFLGDFGIAKIVAESDAFDREATLTATSMGVGTPDYMAPEMFTPKALVDGRVDQYALAVIAYEMLAGTRPFTGDVAQVFVAVATQPPPRLDQQVAGLPASAVEAVHRGLAKRPADRFPSCRQFAAALLRDIPSLADESDTARFLCPSCSNLLKLPGTAAGRKGKCPKCKEEMQVAADLGALWLLDEVERQQAGPAGQASVTDWTLAQDGAAADDAAPEFTPISTLKGGTKIARRPKGFLPWIDSHGLVVATALGITAVLPWLVPWPSPSPPRPKTETADVQTLRKELAETRKREADLERQRAELQASRDDTQRLVEELEAQLARSGGHDPAAIITNSIGIKLKLIPAGTFMMGSAEGDQAENPYHSMTITRPFYLGVTEVTNAEWKLVMAGAPPSNWKDDARPVEKVTWDEAVEFCRQLSAIPEEKAAGRLYRLPTEAEWEYACRAGSKTPYSFGDEEALLGKFSVFSGNANNATQPVGQKLANAWGLYDMHGNVWEWCSDIYGDYPSQASPDYAGPTVGSDRVRRGGGYVDGPATSRSASRHGLEPSRRGTDLGFRIALTFPNIMPTTAAQSVRDDEKQPPQVIETGIRTDPSAADILARPPLVNSIGIPLKLIPAGSFQMGSDDGEADEKPVQVQITNSFYLAATEVTNDQWKAVMGGEPPSRWKDADRPVEQVPWTDTIEFCKKLSDLPVERAAGRAYRLPTEAEWEYACRAGTTTRWASGDDEKTLGDLAWFQTNTDSQTYAVGRKRPNAWGLHDMHGNVREWCHDWYGPYATGVVADPSGPTKGSMRVGRGGACANNARDCRSANRGYNPPETRFFGLGFRLAMSPSEGMVPEAGK